MSRTAEETAQVAAALRHAADIIESRGYTPYPEYEGEEGTDVCGALDDAAGPAGIFAEHAHDAFAGYLQLTGQVSGAASSYHADGRITEWERRHGRRPAHDVTARLRAAAAVIAPSAGAAATVDERLAVDDAAGLAAAAADPDPRIAAAWLASHGLLPMDEAVVCDRATVYAAGFGAAGGLLGRVAVMLASRAGIAAAGSQVPAARAS